MIRNLINKIVFKIYKKCDNYLYIHCYMPKHADKDFWDESDLL